MLAADEREFARVAFEERSGELAAERERKRKLVSRLRGSRARERAALAELETAARALEDAAMKQCIKDGYQVSVAVVARSGVTKVLLRADGASPHTVGSSTGKAFTSASMGQPTMKLANLIKEKPELEELREMDDRMLILAGGLPIKIDGALVGGIGVSGVPEGHLDQKCAQVGIDSITK